MVSAKMSVFMRLWTRNLVHEADQPDWSERPRRFLESHIGKSSDSVRTARLPCEGTIRAMSRVENL